MKDEEIKSGDLIELVNKFHNAIQASDFKTINEITDDKLFFERNMKLAGKGKLKKTVSANEILSLKNFPDSLRKIEPIIFIGKKRCKVIFEKFSCCILPKPKFNRAFLRQTYCFVSKNEEWKITGLKDELFIFSKYNVKLSLLNLLEGNTINTINSVYKINER